MVVVVIIVINPKVNRYISTARYKRYSLIVVMVVVVVVVVVVVRLLSILVKLPNY